MSQNILFFSQNCQHSKKLLAKIINTPLYGNLQKVCVDDPQTRSRLPKWVTCVPLIYLAQAHPTFQNPLKDNDINMWIESQISQMQSRNQPPQQQFQQQNQNLNQQQQQQQPPTAQQQSLVQDTMGFEAYNSLEMGGGIASDNYSMFSNEDSPVNNNLFPHSYETISGSSFGSQNPQPKGSGNAFAPPQQSNNSNNLSSNSNDSRSSQKQDKFEQDLAMKKALRDQDSVPQTNRKTDGVPQNFNQMWEQNNTF